MNEKALFGAGCFWCIEDTFGKEPGVLRTSVGYTGGHTDNPTYEAVCTGRTGHAEVTEVEFDPSLIKYETLLQMFWDLHDPTTLNKQGPDVGSQYRSAIFYMSDTQRALAEKSKAALEEAGRYHSAIVTEIVAATHFYRAEEYHQQYYCKRGIGQ